MPKEKLQIEKFDNQEEKPYKEIEPKNKEPTEVVFRKVIPSNFIV